MGHDHIQDNDDAGGRNNVESDLLDLTGIAPGVLVALPESAFGRALGRALDTAADYYAGHEGFQDGPSAGSLKRVSTPYSAHRDDR